MKDRIEVHDMRMNVVGRTYRPFERDPKWKALSEKERDQIIDEAVIHGDGILLTGTEAEKVKARLLRKPPKMAPMVDPTSPEWALREYIPGYWEHTTIPALIAPKGWGKTRYLCNKCAALIIPGRRFLGFFDPVQVTDEERARDIWLMNAETAPGAVHRELLRAGLVFGNRDGLPCYAYRDPEDRDYGVLWVEHLVARKPTEFDLTDEVVFDYWIERLTNYTNRKVPPLTVLVDGVTAILRQHTTRTGEFSGALKELLREVGIPNGLGTLHSPMNPNVNTPMQGLESYAEWDGSWTGSAPAFPIRKATPRWLTTEPRLGGLEELSPHQVVIDDDGLLLLVPPDSKRSTATPDAGPDRRERLLTRLREGPAEGLVTKEVCGPGDEYKLDRAELDRMESDGLVVREDFQVGRSRGTRWRLSD